jgi:alkanesulfonate monooxygenase SsuD/methylene tetrahydromethanopterin reductase-like flavin-dependent oxidoreductase (luciferase family)
MPYLYSARRYAESVATIRAIADAESRDLSAFEWFVFVFVNVHDERDDARDETARFLGGTYRQDFDALLDRVALAGTPADVARGLDAFVDAGARHFILAPASRTNALDVVARVVDEVIPRVGTPPPSA